MRRSQLTSLLLLLACMAGGLATEARADHWKRHDGRWYYWNDGDTRWYHMDGQNWFYNKDNRWTVYRFDGRFGDDWDLDRDELEFDDDLEVPKYAPPPIPTPRVKVVPPRVDD
jgi:hypothetical protein